MKENKDRAQGYPQPSTADEQFRNQDEFSTQKPNEKASNNSDLPQPAIKEPDSAPGDKNYKDSRDQGKS